MKDHDRQTAVETEPGAGPEARCQVCGAPHERSDAILCRACGEPVLLGGWAP